MTTTDGEGDRRRGNLRKEWEVTSPRDEEAAELTSSFNKEWGFKGKYVCKCILV